jgi:hypothetical protein
VDFGLAARDDAGSQRVGTPHYMAPEICENGQAQPVSDVYALGVTLFHMLTGAPPYAGLQVKDILQAHIRGEALHPERKVPGLMRDAAELLRRMTKREPMLRPTAAEVVTELDTIGGQDLRQKETLRGRKSRARSRSQAAARSPAVFVIAGVVVVGIVGVVMAMSGGGGKGTPPTTPPAPPTQGYGPGKGPETNIPLPVVETEAQKTERLRREAEAAKSKREADATAELKALESWIRAKWQTKSDDAAVLVRYRAFKTAWNGTEAGKTVEERIRLISSGKMHPHPDRSYGDVEKIEAARKQLADNLPKVEEHIAKHEYLVALTLLPEPVEDTESTLGAQIRFWRQAVEHLSRFQSALAAEWEAIPAVDRVISVGGEEAKLKKVVAGGGYEVELGGETRRLTWADVPNEQTFRLARAAFVNKDASTRLLSLAFAWAHRLSDEFWETILDLKNSDAAKRVEKDVAAYERAWEDRTR